MSRDFKDHFSSQSTGYALYRPRYPAALFAFLASLTSGHESVWDCATGSGQAALGLADHYDRVMATDASAKQIVSARMHPKIRYLVATAEAAPFPDNSQDLVTVAQALHWFHLASFYQEVERVLKPDGVIAAWTYNLIQVSSQVDELIFKLYHQVLSGYWPEERQLVESGYADIPFPFEEVHSGRFSMTAEWSSEQLLGYLGTWSAVQRYRDRMQADPLVQIEGAIKEAWPNRTGAATVCWPLMLRIGRTASV